MTPTDPLERLTLLERAQLLHDATLRRHGEHLDHHVERMDALQRNQDLLIAQQTASLQLLGQHAERMAALVQLLQAIKDMLKRPNGH